LPPAPPTPAFSVTGVRFFIVKVTSQFGNYVVPFFNSPCAEIIVAGQKVIGIVPKPIHEAHARSPFIFCKKAATLEEFMICE
jgi:hypothetical protein